MKNINHKHVEIQIEDYHLKFKIIREYRNNLRVSLGKEHIILRVPIFSFVPMDTYIQRAKEWLINIEQQKPDILNRYRNGDQHQDDEMEFTILGKYFTRVIKKSSPSTKSYCIFDSETNELQLFISETLDNQNRKKISNQLIFGYLKKTYTKELNELVRYYNAKYFNRNIRAVRLKNNTSNWGSCSTTGNINISAKTLLLPYDIIEYVIIHELAHLIELNHSKGYWKIVEDILPDYKKMERFLKEFGFKYGF